MRLLPAPIRVGPVSALRKPGPEELLADEQLGGWEGERVWGGVPALHWACDLLHIVKGAGSRATEASAHAEQVEAWKAHLYPLCWRFWCQPAPSRAQAARSLEGEVRGLSWGPVVWKDAFLFVPPGQVPPGQGLGAGGVGKERR